ncbi:Fructosamine/Ketosamine-3-kinase [Thelephora terrestris]|uniref:protein-ribulosamine 3-kinase n=1 Tax=Thelephora terrestris TaxID=56493 RepID=A0A9P6HFI9_9AGAM|nr:Fructosamine/Ketosamine-3-kinase [Thelephora terrestris]
MPPVPKIFLKHLNKLEPDAQFTFSLPRLKSSSGAAYYAKIGTTSEHPQYIAEAESLKALDIAAPGLVPKVLASGFFTGDDEESEPGVGRPYFLSEYKDLRSLSSASAEVFGRRLAEEVHSYKGLNGFGFHVPTYCGQTRMENGWHSSWAKCYDALIAGLLSHLTSSGYSALRTKGEQVRKRVIPVLLDPDRLVVQPVLIHGDLWSGNTGEDQNGQPVIYDPSSMFAHNEFDLAIGRMFGGIPPSFYTEYHKHLPKSAPEEEYDLRSDLYVLFHYLNHTVVFGGSYASGAEQKMDKLLRSFPQG